MTSAPYRDFRLGEWLVQPSLGRISGAGTAVHLRPLLMDLLSLLARNPGQVLSKEEISRSIWARRFLAESALTRLVAELRHSLRDDIDNPRYLETVPKRGYRLIAPVSAGLEAAKPAAEKRSIAVLPFTDMAADGDQEYFCDGLAEELTNALTRLRGLRVIARTSAFAFKGVAVDVREIGRRLDVGAVLEGGVQRSKDRLRITVQLIDASDGCHLWSERFDRAAGDVFAIQDEIAQAVVDALRIHLLDDDRERLLRRYTRDPEAHDLYLKGRCLWGIRTPAANLKAVDCLVRVLQLDPGHALAYAALGECYCTSGFLGFVPPDKAFPSAKAAARSALEIDPALSEAHAVLGFATGAYDWNWGEAERCLLRAEHLSPSCVQARVWHSVILSAVGRFEESLAEIERAWDLDPLSPLTQANLGWMLFEARHYRQSLERCLRTVEVHPGFKLGYFHLGRACYALGRFQEALHALEKADPAYPAALATLGVVCAKAGRRDKAAKILDDLRQLATRRYVGPAVFALLHEGLGNRDDALEWYEKAFSVRDGVVAILGVDPWVDPLRSEPRFQALVQRLGLPVAPAEALA